MQISLPFIFIIGAPQCSQLFPVFSMYPFCGNGYVTLQSGKPVHPTNLFPLEETLITMSFPHFGHFPMTFWDFIAALKFSLIVFSFSLRDFKTSCRIFLDFLTTSIHSFYPSAISSMSLSSCAVISGFDISYGFIVSITAKALSVGIRL